MNSWHDRGVTLSREHRLRQFEIADWLVEGIEQLGVTEAYDFAEKTFPQYARATFQSWVTVAKHFLPSIRIESDWLTFKHYQVAQGAESDPWSEDPNSKFQIAQEMVWLRQADEKQMSASILREAISRAYELRRTAFLDEHPELKPAEPEPEPVKDTKRKQKDAYGADVKELKTPWLPKRARFHLDELARARRVTTEQLLNRLIQDFLDAHCDEIGDVEAAAKKREAEVYAQIDAAATAEQAKREQVAKAHAEKAEREQQEKATREQKRREEFLAKTLVEEIANIEIVRVLEASG